MGAVVVLAVRRSVTSFQQYSTVRFNHCSDFLAASEEEIPPKPGQDGRILLKRRYGPSKGQNINRTRGTFREIHMSYVYAYVYVCVCVSDN